MDEEVLKEALEYARDLLETGEQRVWSSKAIRYQKPHVNRIFVPWKESRISLHEILPCMRGESFVHPHPWESVVLLLEGTYETGFFAAGRHGTYKDLSTFGIRSLATVRCVPGSIYTMGSKDVAHYVAPFDGPTYSFMVTGPADPHRALNPFQIPESGMEGAEVGRLVEKFRGLLDAYGGI